MPLQCNIDVRGKLVRLICGMVLLIIGIVLLFLWATASNSVMAWAVTIVLILDGAFAIFEARAGWCILRAMGWKTRI